MSVQLSDREIPIRLRSGQALDFVRNDKRKPAREPLDPFVAA